MESNGVGCAPPALIRWVRASRSSARVPLFACVAWYKSTFADANVIPLARRAGDVHPARSAFAYSASSPERTLKAGVQPFPNPLFTCYISSQHWRIELNFIPMYKSQKQILPCCGFSEQNLTAEVRSQYWGHVDDWIIECNSWLPDTQQPV